VRVCDCAGFGPLTAVECCTVVAFTTSDLIILEIVFGPAIWSNCRLLFVDGTSAFSTLPETGHTY
jgi:hypothetical protein